MTYHQHLRHSQSDVVQDAQRQIDGAQRGDVVQTDDEVTPRGAVVGVRRVVIHNVKIHCHDLCPRYVANHEKTMTVSVGQLEVNTGWVHVRLLMLTKRYTNTRIDIHSAVS